MMIVAGCAVLFNIILGLVLHGICKVPHSHSHGGDSHHSHNKHLKRGHEHLTSHSKLHSESDSDVDYDVEESQDCKKQVRQTLLISISWQPFLLVFVVLTKRLVCICYYDNLGIRDEGILNNNFSLLLTSILQL